VTPLKYLLVVGEKKGVSSVLLEDDLPSLAFDSSVDMGTY
jgi:hypothetical protein